MTEVVIRNKNIQKLLDDTIDEFRSIPDYNHPRYHLNTGGGTPLNGHYYAGEDHLRDDILNKTPTIWHKGPPEYAYSFQISNAKTINPDKFAAFEQKTKGEFPKILGSHSNALTSFYPPGGFVSWHTNWDAHCYQLLFTWSETGAGYFSYYDIESDSIVKIPDVKGWQCRHFYFGRIDEPKHHCWHTAHTECERFTLAYKFKNESLDSPKDALAQQMRDMLIDEIELDIDA